MYQSLIWARVVRNDPRCLGAALDPKGVKRLADALIHGVRGDLQLRRDLFRRQVLVNEAQAVELPCAQPCDARYHLAVRRAVGPVSRVRHARDLLLQNTRHPPI
jgi:hypothetical protein